MISLSAWRKASFICKKQTPDTVREGAGHGYTQAGSCSLNRKTRRCGRAQKHGIAYPETAENQISAIANQGSRMLQNEVTPQMVSFFYTYFRGRKDVYSVRSRPKDGKAGYFPACTLFGITNSARKRQGENCLQGLPEPVL